MSRGMTGGVTRVVRHEGSHSMLGLARIDVPRGDWLTGGGATHAVPNRRQSYRRRPTAQHRAQPIGASCIIVGRGCSL